MTSIQGTLMPFLYPCLLRPTSTSLRSKSHRLSRQLLRHSFHSTSRRRTPSLIDQNTVSNSSAIEPPLTPTPQTSTHLNPSPDDYSRNIFVDKCVVTVSSGSGGSGCVSFLRDVHISDGPPNGGDGGSGGSIYIQAVAGQTSLHKLARRGIIKAGRGIGGQGSSQGGRRGEDICVQVPVGTVVREIWRSDPQADEEARLRELRATMTEDQILELPPEQSGLRSKFVIYAGAITMESRREIASQLPSPTSQLVRSRKSHLSVLQPKAPITLDLDKPMDQPILLCAGAVGGLGNPHFASKENMKPKYALKGELGVRIKLELELKLLADVGLVGLPNAGKSTLTRAISNSRTRIGDWAFTTLSPTIGTVILDKNVGRPLGRSGTISHESSPDRSGSGTIVPRSKFTVADIPGLIEDAHLDKGLGLSFLRHVERARILAFVVDLSAGDAVTQLKALWKEVSEYENLRDREVNEQSESRDVEQNVQWSPFQESRWSTPINSNSNSQETLFNEEGERISVFESGQAMGASKSGLEPLRHPPISAKPWFVIATKADIPTMNSPSPSESDASLTDDDESSQPSQSSPSSSPSLSTQSNFLALHKYISSLSNNETPHPSGRRNGWRQNVAAIPVSAIRGEGINTIIRYTAGVLDSLVVGR